MTIQFVEDDPAVRDSARLVLESAGFTVGAYPSAEQFFATCILDDNDLCLIDLDLPGIHGDRLLYWLDRMGLRRRVVVISGLSPRDIRKRVDPFPIAMVLRKPLTADRLLSAVRDVLAETVR